MSPLRRTVVTVALSLPATAAVAVGFGAFDRALMRFVALGSGDPVEFSWPGTTAIVVVIFITSLPGVLALLALQRRMRWIGYALAVLGTFPHWPNLAAAIAGYGEGPLPGHLSWFVTAITLYLASLTGQVLGTARLTRALHRRLLRALAAAPALP
jgi:hypothetical protein